MDPDFENDAVGDAAEDPDVLDIDLRQEVVYDLLIPFSRKTRDAHQVVHQEEVTCVTITRPKAKHLKVAARFKTDEEQSLALVGPLTGLTDREVDELDLVDLMRIGDIIKGFTQPGRRSGATTSAI